MKKKIFATFDKKVSERKKRHREIAYQAVAESIVLLENNGFLLNETTEKCSLRDWRSYPY